MQLYNSVGHKTFTADAPLELTVELAPGNHSSLYLLIFFVLFCNFKFKFKNQLKKFF